jgi:hypothetical protein
MGVIGCRRGNGYHVAVVYEGKGPGFWPFGSLGKWVYPDRRPQRMRGHTATTCRLDQERYHASERTTRKVHTSWKNGAESSVHWDCSSSSESFGSLPGGKTNVFGVRLCLMIACAFDISSSVPDGSVKRSSLPTHPLLTLSPLHLRPLDNVRYSHI